MSPPRFSSHPSSAASTCHVSYSIFVISSKLFVQNVSLSISRAATIFAASCSARKFRAAAPSTGAPPPPTATCLFGEEVPPNAPLRSGKLLAAVFGTDVLAGEEIPNASAEPLWTATTSLFSNNGGSGPASAPPPSRGFSPSRSVSKPLVTIEAESFAAAAAAAAAACFCADGDGDDFFDFLSEDGDAEGCRTVGFFFGLPEGSTGWSSARSSTFFRSSYWQICCIISWCRRNSGSWPESKSPSLKTQHSAEW
mmetsp:Transcript_4750/g.11658  ORF Transcript_4750/g.11658 Transcript_4750/m.11658 type:complete len:253 (+) Transcript_4750:2281-3039(+)